MEWNWAASNTKSYNLNTRADKSQQSLKYFDTSALLHNIKFQLFSGFFFFFGWWWWWCFQGYSVNKQPRLVWHYVKFRRDLTPQRQMLSGYYVSWVLSHIFPTAAHHSERGIMEARGAEQSFAGCCCCCCRRLFAPPGGASSCCLNFENKTPYPNNSIPK